MYSVVILLNLLYINKNFFFYKPISKQPITSELTEQSVQYVWKMGWPRMVRGISFTKHSSEKGTKSTSTWTHLLKETKLCTTRLGGKDLAHMF